MGEPTSRTAGESEDPVTGEHDAESNGVPTSDDTYSEDATEKGVGSTEG